MAKKQTFKNKLNKKAANQKTQIKLIRSFLSKGKNSIRFSEEILHVPEGKTIETHLKEIIKS